MKKLETNPITILEKQRELLRKAKYPIEDIMEFQKAIVALQVKKMSN